MVLVSHQNQKRILQDGYHSSTLVNVPQLKTRKVSSVRDFPPGCGRNVCQTADLASGESATAVMGDNIATGLEVSGANGETCFESMEDWNQIQNHDLPKELDEAVTVHAVESYVSDEVVPASIGETCSSPQFQISKSSAKEEPSSSIQKKYCSRRVSSKRDFPTFCGRNPPKPVEGNCKDTVKAISDKAIASIEEPCVDGADSVAGKEMIVYSQQFRDDASGSDVEEKSKMDSNDGFDSVVQALMAEPVCPWRQGGKDFTGSDSVRKKGEVKKQTSSYRERYSAVAKKSCVKKATLFSIEVKKGGESSTLGNSEVILQHQSPEFDLALRPFGCDDSSRGDGHDKGRVKSKAMSKEVGHKSAVYKKAIAKKRPVCKIADGGEGSQVPSYDDDEGTCGSPDRHILPKFDVTLPPFGPSGSTQGDARSKVKETLRLFQVLCRKVLQGEESKTKPDIKRIDIVASKIIKERGKEVNTEKLMIGEVPGVEVGDEFQYRVELALIGIHRLYQAGIDYTKHGNSGMIIAVSIVASGGYADEMDDPDVLVYSGQGGNVVGKSKTPEDQKLEKGNLALRNSISVKNPVRVVRGYKEVKTSESVDAKPKVSTTYVYDGLYTVTNYWTEENKHHKMVFMFELRRIPGQADLFWKEVKSSKKSTVRHGVCVDDITGGKELLPICAINRINSEKPPPFKYIRKVKYPEWFHPSPPKGCGCTSKCSDSKKCLCAVRNGGELPYNRNGAIVEVKPLVYECGPHCKCPPSCYNRVSQNGIKIQLEIFKTESRGWGVRSLTSIPSGTFICEYAGELLEDKEAERRIGIDEYLFDIGHNNGDSSINPSGNNELGEDVGYTIDAAEYGNVGRFINHSCSPNLYAQNVLYDYEDKKTPHIMLFAADNIPPLRELTYHYNYIVGQVRDSSGNIKVKECFCGSADCTGRLY